MVQMDPVPFTVSLCTVMERLLPGADLYNIFWKFLNFNGTSGMILKLYRCPYLIDGILKVLKPLLYRLTGSSDGSAKSYQITATATIMK